MSDTPGWIRVRHGLESEPEVVRVALRLRRSPFEIVGRLLRLWSWFATRTEDGLTHIADDRRAALAWVDEELLELRGMATALEEVGWLEVEDGGETRLPGFDRWIESAKRTRRYERERKRLQRVKKADVPADVPDLSHPCPGDVPRDNTGTPRSRSRSPGVPQEGEDQEVSEQVGYRKGTVPKAEESPKGPIPAKPKGPAWYRSALSWPLPAELDLPQVRRAWEGWVEARRLKGDKGVMSERACELAVAKLAEWGPELAVEALDKATMSGWVGIFDPRENPWGKAKGEDHEDALAEHDRAKETERYMRRLGFKP